VSKQRNSELSARQVLHLDRALRLVWQSGPGLTLASLALVLIQGVLPLASLYLMKLVVDTVTAGLASPDKSAAFSQVVFYIVLTGAVALISSAVGAAANFVSEAQGLNVTDRVQDIIHAKSIEADLEYYEHSQYYDTLHRAQQEAPYRPTRILNGLLQVGQNLISLVAMVGLLLSLHWGVAVALFITAIPNVLVRLKYAKTMYRWSRRRTPAERLAWYFDWMLTRDAHAKEVRLFELGTLFRSRYRELRKQLRHERLRIVSRRSLADLGAQVVATLGVFGSYAFIAYRTVLGIVTLGDLVMYYQAFQRGQGFLRDVLGGMAGLYEDSLFLSNLYEFLDLKRKVVEPARPQPVPRPMRDGIVFDRVRFSYPESGRNVLENINLRIRPGEVVALVGENGSGKTTLVKLLCRLYDPTEGSITLDGIDLRDIETTTLRREMSVIFQDYAHYNLTARENIWFGNVAVPADDAAIAEAARQAGADQVIQRLPRGYDTVLGKWFEEGEELSIGEWQKVALARAFLRDAQIIVLDEPTSAMDAKSEYEVFERFRKLLRGRAAILISHRFSTVRMADNIYVLEGGRIIEGGPHDDLVRLGGTYARLFETQARQYR
jgi:ATP-binding cassette subfamily B protein